MSAAARISLGTASPQDKACTTSSAPSGSCRPLTRTVPASSPGDQGTSVSSSAISASAMVDGRGRSGGPLGVTVGGQLGVTLGGVAVGGTGGVLVAGGIEGSCRSATPCVGSPVNGSVAGESVSDGRPATEPLVAEGCAGGHTTPGSSAPGRHDSPGWPASSSDCGGEDGLGVSPRGIGGNVSPASPGDSGPATGAAASTPPPPPGNGINGAPILGPPSRLITSKTAYRPTGAATTAATRRCILTRPAPYRSRSRFKQLLA